MATDVCTVLGIGNPRQATTRLDDNERGVMSTDSSGGVQSVAAVNESGLYSLVIGSRKPETQRFRHWVTHKALTAIRRAGRYARAELSPVLAMRPKVTSQHLAACGLQIRISVKSGSPARPACIGQKPCPVAAAATADNRSTGIPP